MVLSLLHFNSSEFVTGLFKITSKYDSFVCSASKYFIYKVNIGVGCRKRKLF